MKKILLVDDEVYIYNFIKRFLKKEFDNEYMIDYAHNGREGLMLFNSNHYDIIFTDHTMPVMTGEELIQEIRKTDKKIPIVLITGSSDTAIKDMVVLQKPFDLNKIRQTLEDL